MCYKRKCECPHYMENLIAGNHNACGNCEYIIRMKRWQKMCKISLGIAGVVFLVMTYFLY